MAVDPVNAHTADEGVQGCMMDVEDLFLAMAPTNQVLRALNDATHVGTQEVKSTEDRWKNDVDLEITTLNQQDYLASLISKYWPAARLSALERSEDGPSTASEEIYGPSKRYMHKLVQRFVRQLNNENKDVESEGLLTVLSEYILPFSSVLSSSFASQTAVRGDERETGGFVGEIDAEDHCFLTFRLPDPSYEEGRSCSTGTPLRLRVCPNHNDVALRLWEGGASLAELFMSRPQLLNPIDSSSVQRDCRTSLRIIEIGAGVGLTSLVAAHIAYSSCSCWNSDASDCCRQSHHNVEICCTDYTEAALVNLRYNIHKLNSGWLRNTCRCQCCTRARNSSEVIGEEILPITVTQLDWEDFIGKEAAAEGIEMGEAMKGSSINDKCVSPGMAALASSSVLLAADVAYDPDTIPSLVETILFFFRYKASSGVSGNSSHGDEFSSDQNLKKKAFFAMTLRNTETFDLLREALTRKNLSIEMIASGDDCAKIPRYFPTQFVQPRKDVKIFSLFLRR